MKKLTFLLVLTISIILVKCTVDDQGQRESGASTPSSLVSTNRIYQVDLDQYIKDFYSDNFVYGDSLATNDSLNSFIVKEVIVGKDVRARGYLVKNSTTGDPLYFADVNRVDAAVTFVDLFTEEVEKFENLDNNPIYLGNGLDFMEIVAAANNNMTNKNMYLFGVTINLDNFWTNISSCGSGSLKLNPSTQQIGCYSTCSVKKKRFWITWSNTEVSFVSSNDCN